MSSKPPSTEGWIWEGGKPVTQDQYDALRQMYEQRRVNHVSDLTNCSNEVERLQEALREYGGHKPECRAHNGPCTCGYADTMNASGPDE